MSRSALDQWKWAEMILLTGQKAAGESCGDVVILSLVRRFARYRGRAKPKETTATDLVAAAGIAGHGLFGAAEFVGSTCNCCDCSGPSRCPYESHALRRND